MARRSIAALLSVLGLLLFSGCSQAADEATEKSVEKQIEKEAAKNGEDVDIDIDDDEVSVESSDGTLTVGKDQLPEGFPESEIPLVDGEIKLAIAVEDGWSVAVAVDGSAAEAAKEAVAKLKGAGFTAEDGISMESMAMLKNDTYSVMVTGNGDSGTELVTYIIGKT